MTIDSKNIFKALDQLIKPVVNHENLSEKKREIKNNAAATRAALEAAGFAESVTSLGIDVDSEDLEKEIRDYYTQIRILLSLTDPKDYDEYVRKAFNLSEENIVELE